jgi:hypothetical protein
MPCPPSSPRTCARTGPGTWLPPYAFTAEAAVTDEGRTVRGREAIGAWLNNAGSEYTFSTTFTGATVPDAAHVDVVQRLEGDFPGGVADLHYRFTLDGDRICDLVIAP